MEWLIGGLVGMAIGYEIRDRMNGQPEKRIEMWSVILWAAWIPLVILAGVT